MKNRELWRPKRFMRDAKGRIIGTYNHKIIGNAYEPTIRKYSKGMLADIGCGDVPYYIFYKDLVKDNICIDWENSSLDVSFLDFVADLNEPIKSLNSSSFDTVLCTDVLEHIYAPDVLVSEMSRILKPGGHLILTVPFLYWIHESPHDYHRYTKFRLKKFCKDHGMEAIELQEYGGLPEIVFDLIYKGINYYKLPLRKQLTFSFFKLGYLMAKFKFINRLSLRSRSTFPMGYVLVAKKNQTL